MARTRESFPFASQFTHQTLTHKNVKELISLSTTRCHNWLTCNLHQPFNRLNKYAGEWFSNDCQSKVWRPGSDCSLGNRFTISRYQTTDSVLRKTQLVSVASMRNREAAIDTRRVERSHLKTKYSYLQHFFMSAIMFQLKKKLITIFNISTEALLNPRVGNNSWESALLAALVWVPKTTKKREITNGIESYIVALVWE